MDPLPRFLSKPQLLPVPPPEGMSPTSDRQFPILCSVGSLRQTDRVSKRLGETPGSPDPWELRQTDRPRRGASPALCPPSKPRFPASFLSASPAPDS